MRTVALLSTGFVLGGFMAGPVDAFQSQAELDLSNLTDPFHNLVPEKLDRHVNRFLNEDRRRRFLLEGLARSGRYVPLIREIFKEKGIPQELAYVAMVESLFVTDAKSPGGQVGLWQFQPLTARAMGLMVNEYLDEREDPIRSTYAAADYLLRLHKRFGDWSLALVAYNTGPTKVRKTMKETNTSTFNEMWEIEALPYSVLSYVYRIAAVAQLAQVMGE